jgi:hypothetical protein
LEGVLLLGHWTGDDDGFAAFQAGPGQVEHVTAIASNSAAVFHVAGKRQVGWL